MIKAAPINLSLPAGWFRHPRLSSPAVNTACTQPCKFKSVCYNQRHEVQDLCANPMCLRLRVLHERAEWHVDVPDRDTAR